MHSPNENEYCDLHYHSITNSAMSIVTNSLSTSDIHLDEVTTALLKRSSIPTKSTLQQHVSPPKSSARPLVETPHQMRQMNTRNLSNSPLSKDVRFDTTESKAHRLMTLLPIMTSSSSRGGNPIKSQRTSVSSSSLPIGPRNNNAIFVPRQSQLNVQQDYTEDLILLETQRASFPLRESYQSLSRGVKSCLMANRSTSKVQDWCMGGSLRRSLSCPAAHALLTIYREVCCGTEDLKDLVEQGIQTEAYYDWPGMVSKSSPSHTSGSRIALEDPAGPLACWECARYKEKLAQFHEIRQEKDALGIAWRAYQTTQTRLMTDAESTFSEVASLWDLLGPAVSQLVVTKVDASHQTLHSWLEEAEVMSSMQRALEKENKKLRDELSLLHSQWLSLSRSHDACGSTLERSKADFANCEVQRKAAEQRVEELQEELRELRIHTEYLQIEAKFEKESLLEECRQKEELNARAKEKLEEQTLRLQEDHKAEKDELWEEINKLRKLNEQKLEERHALQFKLDLAQNTISTKDAAIARLEKSVETLSQRCVRQSTMPVTLEPCKNCRALEDKVRQLEADKKSSSSSSSSQVSTNMDSDALSAWQAMESKILPLHAHIETMQEDLARETKRHHDMEKTLNDKIVRLEESSRKAEQEILLLDAHLTRIKEIVERSAPCESCSLRPRLEYLLR